MIKIFTKFEGNEFLIDISGHGELENIEKLDVMCAAVTTLTNALSLTVHAMWDMGLLTEDPILYVGDDGEGNARIKAKATEESRALVATAFSTIITGYRYLSVLYPEHVELWSETAT